ncbi:MAG: methionine--tRNA ligase [Dehalococcoidia bacterium]|nr:methionine--tRNA ligase [Dehalococcoidia bacterium]MDD5493993.1 methionine--tRNA ligase [Dehalococcoidia bacterium]
MPENILVAVAWPYANGSLHLGHIAGAYLPADVFARYHRLKGNRVLMVSGSDQHGTPITLRAEQEGISPAAVAAKYHQEFLECWQKLGITFDLFTNTGTANHAAVTHDIFLRLLEKGYIYKDTMPQAYCPQCKRFLPDRYIEGTCPFCQYDAARGDQCDQCGRTLNPSDLIGLRCRTCGTVPRFETSEHFFFKLSAFEEKLHKWVGGQKLWRQNVQNFTMGFLEGGLKDRAITRDIEWGVSVPQPGFEKKRIYVWFEAVIGYLSASKEWARMQGDENAWKPFWMGDNKAFYFIGKDNIPFHTIIWPAMLMGYGGLNLPYDVPANEFLTIEGKKLSTSRNWAVWVPDYLKRYDPDPLRYYLSSNMPDTGDTDFSWHEYVRRNNDELVATYGNLAHRVLTFTNRNFNGAVPDPGELDSVSQALIQKAHTTLEEVDKLLYLCRFKESIKIIMSLAQDVNRYLDDTAPWKVIKQDRQAAGRSVYTAIVLISALKTLFYPFLPFSSQKLHAFLGFEGEIQDAGWKLQLPQAGQKLPLPQPLFSKLEDEIIAEETTRLGGGVAP